MSRHRTTLCALIGAIAALFQEPSARAYEEQASLDAMIDGTLLFDADTLPASGVGASFGGGLGVSDLVILRGSLGYQALLGDGDSAHAGKLRFEGVYLLDVLQLVPFFGVGGSFTFARGSGGPSVHGYPGVHALAGIDYLLSRSWVLGVDLRTGLLSETGGFRSTTDLSLRVSRMFETF